jgi:RNA polymerase sigma-70 factor (ECF subfamily)
MSKRFTRRARDQPPRGEHEGLLQRARRQPEVFADFYAQLHEQVLSFFARRTLDPETAFDLMAETFVAAYAALPEFRGATDDEAHAWLWAIARNQLYRWKERGTVERRCLAQLGVELPAMSPAEFERIEELAALDRIRCEVRGALDALGNGQRDAIRLRIIEERPYPAVAEQLGVSEQVARARVSRGLRELAQILEPHHAELRKTMQ